MKARHSGKMEHSGDLGAGRSAECHPKTEGGLLSASSSKILDHHGEFTTRRIILQLEKSGRRHTQKKGEEGKRIKIKESEREERLLGYSFSFCGFTGIHGFSIW